MLPDRIGRYEVRGLAGSGGFATVYEGFDPRLDARVAIKVLADNWSRDPEIRRRFRQEAILLRRLQTDQGVPGLVEVFDIDETDGGQPFFVMGWADRGTLADRAGGRAWEPAEVIPVIRAMTQSLGHLHAAGVVHRDIKPQNLLLRSERAVGQSEPSLVAPGERLLVSDLGLAKDLTNDASAMSLVGGTKSYMAPEQLVFGSSIDHRADIYSATTMIAELLCGSRNERPASPELQRVFANGRAEDPNDRYNTTSEWQTALLSVLEPSQSAHSGHSAPPIAATPDQKPRSGSSRGRFVAAGVAAAVLGLVAIVSIRGSDNPIVGPDTIESGETATYRVDGASPSSVAWTDPSGETIIADSLEITGRLPGRLTFSATVESTTISRSVVVEESPDGPDIIGPERLASNEAAVYTAAVPVGQTFFWVHPTRGEVFGNNLEVVQEAESFVLGLISVDAAGIERGAQLLVTGG